MTRRRLDALTRILALYDDGEGCARAAGLRYVNAAEPGIRRTRRGRGFSYHTVKGSVVSASERARIDALAIPPAWRDVWICAAKDGHLLATGVDERGRTQYLYHERWRAFRDELNFHRLAEFGPRLPSIRAEVEAQLRRRTLDRDLVLAVMLRIVDSCGLRVGSEVYAEENNSYGLTTLTRAHVEVRARDVRFCFPAKSGKHAAVTLTDPPVARVIGRLCEHRSRRLFSVDGSAIDAEEVNTRLAELAGSRVTAKDFRTWHGTRVAFASLRRHLPPGEDAEDRVLEAVDAAAGFLGNTRSVAREHYVHPQMLAAYVSGEFEQLAATASRVRAPRLSRDERALSPFLDALLMRSSLLAGRSGGRESRK